MWNKIEDMSMTLANNIDSKQERDVHYNRIQEDETDSYIEKLKVDSIISLQKHFYTIVQLQAFLVKP